MRNLIKILRYIDNTPKLLVFFRFACVGGLGTLVDVLIFITLSKGLGWHYFVAGFWGFIVAALLNFTLNKLWAFRDTGSDTLQQFGRYFLIALVGLACNQFALWVFIEHIADIYWLAKFFASFCVFLWSFFANYHFTFDHGFTHS
jgi:putative flippase GtrA